MKSLLLHQPKLYNNFTLEKQDMHLTSTILYIGVTFSISKLQKRYGVNGTVLDWLESYLSGRMQSVRIGNETSEPVCLKRGVPQGSVLGPSLFSLYVAPIEDIVESYGLTCAVYADDTQLYISIDKSQLQCGIANLQQCILAIIEWLAINELVCNESKTEAIRFFSRYQKHDLELSAITIGKSNIALASSVRDLGVMLDRHLDMRTHINQLCRSASFSLRRVGQVRRYLATATTEKLTHALITCKLDQCNSLLYGLPDKDISKIQRIQNSAARLVTGTKRREHISSVLRNLHWLPIKKRIIYKILLLTYKSLKGLAPDYLKDLLDQYVPTRTLRSGSKHLLCVPRVRTKNYGERAFSFCGPKLWNDLPSSIKQATSVDIFKKDLKTFLFNKDVNF